MIVINGSSYRLCLLDTNVVSEMVKNPRHEFRNFIERLIPQREVPCFSLFSILELRQRPDVFTSFLNLFSAFPCLLLKSHEQLLQDEVALYPNPSQLDPVLFSPLAIKLPQNMDRRAAIEHLLDSPAITVDGQKWLDARDDVLDGMLAHVPNFQPNASKYSKSQIRLFIEVVVLEQVAMRDLDFVKEHISRSQAVAIDSFQSVKMIAYTVFYKFYPDKTRRPSRSDVFDIIISALFPYVDAVITERHQAEVIRKIKERDNFLSKLEVRTLRSLRN